MGAGRSCTSCSGHTVEGSVSLNTVLNDADTGDIILFNNPFLATDIIKVATDSEWDHVGMVLKYSDNPLETIIIESVGCGVSMYYLEQRLKQCLKPNDGSEPSYMGWRRLQGKSDRSTWKREVHKYAESLIDTPYEQNFSDFVKAWIGDSTWSASVLSFMGGSVGEGATKGEDLNSLFCSELCAAIYKHAQILDHSEERDANAYAPRDFASQGNAHLTLHSPWKLDREKQVLYSDEEVAREHASKVGASPTGNDNGGTVGSMMKRASEKAEKQHTEKMRTLIAKLGSITDPADKANFLKQIKEEVEAAAADAAAAKNAANQPAAATTATEPAKAEFDKPDKQKAGCCM